MNQGYILKYSNGSKVIVRDNNSDEHVEKEKSTKICKEETCKDLQVMNLLSEINELKKEIVFYEKFLKEIDLKIERIQLYGYKNAD